MDSEDYLQEINQNLKDFMRELIKQSKEINNNIGDVKNHLSDISDKLDQIIEQKERE